LAEAIHVIVVAPDKDFRRSLEFALETEGFAVDSHPTISRAFSTEQAEEADCAVVDDAAIGDWHAAEKDFHSFGRPIVLLLTKFRAAPRLPLTVALAKPFLGIPLIEAIREIVPGRV